MGAPGVTSTEAGRDPAVESTEDGRAGNLFEPDVPLLLVISISPETFSTSMRPLWTVLSFEGEIPGDLDHEIQGLAATVGCDRHRPVGLDGPQSPSGGRR